MCLIKKHGLVLDIILHIVNIDKITCTRNTCEKRDEEKNLKITLTDNIYELVQA